MGALAGSALFPTQLPNGPKITDNRTTTSMVGEPVPIGFGTFTVAGTVIWLAPYVEHEDESGGKGGPQQTTYSYTQSIAIGLCERVKDDDPDEVGAIAGVSRIWENGTIVYDIRPQQDADTATGQIAESDLDYANRLTASAAYAEGFTLHLGTEDQIADPTIEAIEGFGNVLGFRALAYMVYTNRSLAMSQGLRHPNFTFECYTSGTGACSTQTHTSNEVLYPWNSGATTEDPTNSANTNTFYLRHVDSNLSTQPSFPGDYNTPHTSLAAVQALAATCYGYVPDVFISYSSMDDTTPARGNLGQLCAAQPTPGPGVSRSTNIYSLQLHFNFAKPSFTDLSGNGPIFNPIFGPADTDPTSPYWIPDSQWEESYTLLLTTPFDRTAFPSPPSPTGKWRESQGSVSNYWYFATQDLIVAVYREPAAPLDPCAGLPAAPFAGYCIRGDGRYVKSGPWTRDTSQNYAALRSFSTAGGNVTISPLNPCIPEHSPNDNATFWTAAYNAAVTAGDMPSGMTYAPDGSGGAGTYPMEQNFGYTIDETICDGAGADVSVAAIVAAICQRAGMTAAQYDVADLVGTYVNGYAISSVSAGVDIIAPLRSVAFFDGVESSTQIKFVTRGKEVVATFTTDDFGAYDGGSGSTVPPAITSSRADETTLPRTIRLHYKSVARDYEDDQQQSPFRLTTSAVNDQDLSLPLCLGDTFALQCADIVWADAWAAKDGHELSVDQSWSALEVADCIAVPVDKFIQRLRIVSDTNSAGVLRKLSCVRDNQGSYISYAIANPPARQPQKLKLIAPTNALFLDLPALQDADSNPGFYMAAQRAAGGNSWGGCQIYKSTDGGSTFVTQFAIVNESTVGTLQDAVPASPHYTYDDSTDIIVNVLSAAYSFSSVTDAQLIAGLNAAAMGADGRWEIVQFGEAVQLSTTQWRLSRLLRGRRGTEHTIGQSVAGDTFALLNAGYLQREMLSTAEISGARIYKVVSIGASYGSGVDTTFTGHAQALKPFSPVDVNATLLSNDDILIRWTRRDRLGRTLMSGVDMPLSEATLAFQIDIYHDSPATVARTLSTASTSVLYTHAQQVADFGSPGPTSLRCAVYQMSAVVGRGIPADQTITIGASP